MKPTASIIALAVLAGCSTGPMDADSAPAEQQLQAMLAGKVAGSPVDCIPGYNANATSFIAPHAIAFRVDPSRIYVSDISRTGCEGLANPTYSLASTSHGPGSLCRGEIVQVRDLRSGMTVGSCPIGEFTPYVRPGT